MQACFQQPARGEIVRAGVKVQSMEKYNGCIRPLVDMCLFLSRDGRQTDIMSPRGMGVPARIGVT